MSTINNTITISAPAFQGVNTTDTPLAMSESYAYIAENCLIDRYGRISTRLGWTLEQTTTSEVTAIGELQLLDGTSKIIYTTADGKVWYDDVDITPTYTGSSTDWKMAELQDRVFLFADGNDPLAVIEVAGVPDCVLANTLPSASVTQPKGYDVISAYGRLWVATETTVYWSDLLAGQIWDSGSAGYLDLNTVFKGVDKVVAVSAHNNFLVIFGEKQIAVYSGANGDPTTTLKLEDLIVGVGCIARDSVQLTGNDILFLSPSGVKSMTRLVQEKSLPLRDVSLNVREELLSLSSQSEAKSFYNEKLNIYFLSFGNTKGYAFNLNGMLENGAFRVTTWNGSILASCYYTASDREVYLGKVDGVGKIGGYSDNNKSFLFRYTTGWLDFGQPVLAKFLKDIASTITVQGDVNFVTKWAYDYNSDYTKVLEAVSGEPISYYGIAEYGIAKYGIADVFRRVKANTNGQGLVVQIGLEASVKDAFISLQRMDIYTTTGRRV